MKISSKTLYAIKTLVDLANYADGGVARVAEIAQRQRIPKKYLEQILLMLKGAGIVRSKRGKDGGYLLVIDPAEIDLASVITLTEDFMSNRPAREGDALDVLDLALAEVWDDIHSYIGSRLQAQSIQDLCL